MTKIESMYRWSGGTDYRHTCYEYPNLKKTKAGKRQETDNIPGQMTIEDFLEA